MIRRQVRWIVITWVILWSGFLAPAVAQAAATIRVAGQVLDRDSKTPVPFANVRVVGTVQGTGCDSTGHFWLKLAPGKYQLEISALGYQTAFVTLRVGSDTPAYVQVWLTPQAIHYSEEVVVFGEMERQPEPRLNSTEAVMEQVEGVTLIKRANFAWEPSLRGMQAAQVGIVIDGMKIFSACVDRMDPVTAYVEVENLQQLDIRKGGFDLTLSPAIGGTINLITNKPDFEKPFSFRTETGLETAARLRVLRSEINFARRSFAVRGTFSIKHAGDFLAGEGRRIAGSGYRKYNFDISLARRWGSRHRLEFSLIGDEARDIGYPVLLMDARKTSSRIVRLEHFWRFNGGWLSSIRAKVYANRINHWMDDYERDVTRRRVMPNMYMPMFGQTRTMGWLEEIRFQKGRHVLNVILDAYRLWAFADMQMIGLEPGSSPAYLVNLGDVVDQQMAVALDYSWMIHSRLWWRTNFRVDVSRRDVTSPYGRQALTGFWNRENFRRHYATLGISTSLEYQLDRYRSIRLSLASGQRMPSHMENYGFFLYNIVDGYFYTGNPDLKPEWSRQLEVMLAQTASRFSYRLVGFVNDIRNYISGTIQSPEFKVYTNLSAVYLVGGEFRGEFTLSPSIAASWRLAYVYGQNRTFEEPLPFIPPLEGLFTISYDHNGLWLAVESRFAAPQRRIAYRTTLEDETPGFAIVNVRGQYAIHPRVTLRFGVENVLDRYYHEHLSVNNFPAVGRNVYLLVGIRIPGK
ncbi:MAG: TonB-dependent receptor [Calditrichaeota bacterium]|nr:TonB-dependent receptor [Calditrichota bacterium]